MKLADGFKAMAETPAQIKALTVGLAIIGVIALVAIVLAVKNAH